MIHRLVGLAHDSEVFELLFFSHMLKVILVILEDTSWTKGVSGYCIITSHYDNIKISGNSMYNTGKGPNNIV